MWNEYFKFLLPIYLHVACFIYLLQAFTFLELVLNFYKLFITLFLSIHSIHVLLESKHQKLTI